jgi:DNA polymerase-3 subunit epsilon
VHQLERVHRRWRCTRCTWEWTQLPVSTCPGVPRYAWWPVVPEQLKTQTQLKELGLAADGPVCGCVAGRSGWYWLYDVRQARKRRVLAPAQAAALAEGRAAQARQRRAHQEAAEQVYWEAEDAEERAHAAMLAADRARARDWARGLCGRADWLVLDTETTGLEDGAEIVQLGLLAHNGRVLLETLTRPARAIPVDATAIHGITDAAVAGAPTFPEVYPILLEACGDKWIVAYNAAFDRSMLERACDRASLPPLMNHWDCAMEHYAPYCGDWSAFHGDYRWHPLPGAGHRADDDCRSVLDLVAWMAHTVDEAQDPGAARFG